jgi:hypothetical protein
MIPSTRVYADPGDRLTGRYSPPRRCVVLTQWGPRRRPEAPACTWLKPAVTWGGPRNVAVRYDDGSEAVIPFSRRLRRA